MAKKWPIVIVGVLVIVFLTAATYPEGGHIITTPKSLGAPIGGQKVECWLGEDNKLTCFDLFGSYTVKSGEQIVVRGSTQPFDCSAGLRPLAVPVAKFQITRNGPRISPLINGVWIRCVRH